MVGKLAKNARSGLEQFVWSGQRVEESIRFWFFSTVCASVFFFVILSRNPVLDLFIEFSDAKTLGLLIFCIALGAISIHENAKSRVIRHLAGGAVWVCAVSAYAVLLKGYWVDPVKNSFIVGGLMPGNDAAGWVQSAWHLLETNEILGMGTRRPLDSGLRALFLTTSGDFVGSIKSTTLCCALSAVFLTVQVKRSYGWLVAVASFTTGIILIKEFLPLSMTELYGFIFGNMGLGALLIAANRQSGSCWFLGLAALSIGLNIRAGPFFLLPMLWLWISVLPHKLGANTTRIKLGLASLFVISIGFLGSLWINKFWSAGGETHGNFVLHIYGMVSGGQGWEAALNDHPELSSDELLSVSIKIFLEKPALFFSYYFAELFEFFRLFLRYELGLSRSLIVLALVWLVLDRRQHVAQR